VIKGLNHFKEYFKEYTDNFILVRGVASYLLLEVDLPRTDSKSSFFLFCWHKLKLSQ